jgi:hypothetical protein
VSGLRACTGVVTGGDDDERKDMYIGIGTVVLIVIIVIIVLALRR